MIVDVVVIAVTVISALVSFLRGFIREVVTIIGVVGGILAAIFFAPYIIPFFRDWLAVNDEGEATKLFDLIPMVIVSDVLSYGVVFIAVVALLSVVSHYMADAAKAIGLGPLDRVLGVVFGVARAVILLAVLYLPFHLLLSDEDKEKYFSESRSFFVIEKASSILAELLPENNNSGESISGKIENELKDKLKEQNLLKKEGSSDSGKETEGDKKNGEAGKGEATKPGDEVLKKGGDTPSGRKTGETGYDEGDREEMNRLFAEPDYND